MTTAHKTQGTELYYANAAATVLKVGNITALGEISSPADDIDVTTLDSTAREFVQGFKTPGDFTFPIVFNSQNASHTALLALKTAGTERNWGIYFSEVATPPTASSSLLVGPTTRTRIVFNGYVKDIQFAFEANDVVRGTVTIKVSGEPVVTAAV